MGCSCISCGLIVHLRFSRKLARRPDIPLAMSSSDFDRSQEPEKLDGSSVVSNLSNSTKPSELIINVSKGTMYIFHLWYVVVNDILSVFHFSGMDQNV